MRKRFLLVHNPIAGPAGRTILRRVLAELDAAGVTVMPFQAKNRRTPSPPDVEAGGFDAVIAAGGDGTVRELVKALAGARVPIGFVPMGTGNVLAHEIGLPTSARGLAEILRKGPSVHLAGARANGEPFFLMASAGFDGDVVRLLDLSWKRRFGKLAYVGPVLKSLVQVMPHLEAEIDGRVHHANWVVVASARHYGGSFVLAPEAGLRAAGLTAILIEAPTRGALLRKLVSLPLGRLTRQEGVTVLPCRRAVIRSEGAPVHTQVDGDPFGLTPLIVEAGGAPFDLIVPPEYAKAGV